MSRSSRKTDSAAFCVASPPPVVYETNPTYPNLFGYLERRSLRRANGLISFGRTVADVQTTRIAAARTTGTDAFVHAVVPPGVDTTAFAPDPVARVVFDLNTEDAPSIQRLGNTLVALQSRSRNGDSDPDTDGARRGD